MKKGQNINAPKRGELIAVEPIRKISDIKAIGKLLRSDYRNHLLFTLGINNGLRISDLLRLKVKDVCDTKVGSIIKVKEMKTQKMNVLVINKAVHKSIKQYLSALKPDIDSYLFYSRKGDNAITVPSVNNLIKSWVRAINLKGNYGCHTLRKTWGYHQRVNHGVGFEILCRRYNHSSPSITMRYLCIQDREVHEILMSEIG